MVKEYEETLQDKNLAVIEEIFSEKESVGENLELILPPSISHYNGLQGVRVKNNHLPFL